VSLLDVGSGRGRGNDEELLEEAAVREENRVPKFNRTAERADTTTRDKTRLRFLIVTLLSFIY
jgi:hypothetical protein